ncbi:MAG: hypothetical protein JJT90_04715 [Ectothiorhodospiraceae bacterium]|nr:hypothetical protein [Ectothiorhodospiraceae bacterium]
MEEVERLHVTTQEQAADTVQALLQAARHQVDLLSPLLDPALYDRPPCLEALRRMVVNAGRHARVRVLVADADAVVSRGHRLIELSRQLSSFIEIRRLAEEDRNEEIAMLLVDGESYLYWGPGTGYQGSGRRHHRGSCRRLRQLFQDCWDRSEPAPSLRRLHL